MKFSKIFKKTTIITACAALVFTGCTTLDEEVIDEVLGSASGNPANTLAAAYDRLGDRTFTDNGGMIAMQEYSSDIALLPTRGSDWGDGGKWRAMHEFTWTTNNAVI